MRFNLFVVPALLFAAAAANPDTEKRAGKEYAHYAPSTTDLSSFL